MSYSFGLGPVVPQRPSPAVVPPAVETPPPPQAVADASPTVSPDPPGTAALSGESQYETLGQSAASAPWEAVSEGLFQTSGPPKVNNAELQQALGGIAAALKATMNELPPGMGAEQIMEQMQELEAKLTALVSPSPAAPQAEQAEQAAAPAASSAETPETPPAEPQAPLTQEQNGDLNTPPPTLETPPDLKEQYDALLEMLRDKRIESLLNHLQGLPVIHRIQDMLEAQKR